MKLKFKSIIEILIVVTIFWLVVFELIHCQGYKIPNCSHVLIKNDKEAICLDDLSDEEALNMIYYSGK